MKSFHEILTRTVMGILRDIFKKEHGCYASYIGAIDNNPVFRIELKNRKSYELTIIANRYRKMNKSDLRMDIIALLASQANTKAI